MTAPPARKPTISDVAHRAGASIAAVSYVLNGNRFVSERLSQRIRTAIQDLDYTPSKMAQSLRRNRTQTIGLIMDDITSRCGALITKGLESAAAEEQHTLIITDLHGVPANEPRSINLLLDQRVDGIIYCGFGAEESRLREIHAGGLPVVMADKPPLCRGLPSVGIDNRAGVLAALGHLEALGHKHILFVNGSEINRNGQLRAAAFREFMIGHKLELADDQIIYGDYTLKHGFQTATRLFQPRNRFTAVFCGDDMIAFGVLAGLKARGLKIPADVAVVGFGDDPISRVFDPSLTTVHYPMEEMGRQAFTRFRALSARNALARNACCWKRVCGSAAAPTRGIGAILTRMADARETDRYLTWERQHGFASRHFPDRAFRALRLPDGPIMGRSADPAEAEHRLHPDG